MDRSGRAHHPRASRTPSVGGSNPPGRLHDTHSAVIQDRQWRQWLDEHHSAAVRELGRVVATSAGTRPLLARPVIWQSDVGEASPVWHALAVTDRFVVAVDLTISRTARPNRGRGAPTGQVLNDTTAFRLPGTTTASLFIFIGEDGDLSAWAGGTAATLMTIPTMRSTRV